MKLNRHCLRTALSLAALVTVLPTQAVDFDGCSRAGPGATKRDEARACHNLGISGGHYRLGNECDFLGEFDYDGKKLGIGP